MYHRIVLGVAALCFAGCVHAAEVIITAGSDWNATLAAVANGDTIWVRADAPVPNAITVGKAVRIAAYPGEAPVFDGNGIGSAFSFTQAGHGGTIEGIVFKNYTSYALERSGGSPVVNLRNCVIENCHWSVGVAVNAANTTIKNAIKGGYGIVGSSFVNCAFLNLSQGVGGCENCVFTGTTFTNCGSVANWGDNVVFTDVTVDACHDGIGGLTHVTATNLTLKNSTFGFCGGTNVNVTGLTAQNVTFVAYDISGGTFTNAVVSGSGLYILGACDNVTLDGVQVQDRHSIVASSDNVTVRNAVGANMTIGFTGVNNLVADSIALDGGSMAYSSCVNIDAKRNVITNFRTGASEAFYATSGHVSNSTVAGNGIVTDCVGNGTMSFDSCIFHANGTFCHGPKDLTVSYSLVQFDAGGATLGVGNVMGVLPQFVNEVGGDYRLLANSPAIDSGNPALPVPQDGGSQIDMGAFEFDSTADVSTPPTVTPTTAASSRFSPAFIEGTVSLDTDSVTWDIGGGAQPATLTKNGKFWANVPLSAMAATNLTLTASDVANLTNTQQSLTWLASDLSTALNTITIRKADSLLFTATPAGTTLTIDANGDQTIDFTGAPGDKFPFQYATAGTFLASASIDGSAVGSVLVVVMDVDLSGPIFCTVNTQVQKNIPVTPFDYRQSVVFVANDIQKLVVSEVGPYGSQGTTIAVTPLFTGAILQARLDSTTGPIIAYKEISSFNLIFATGMYSPVMKKFSDEDELVGGCLRMEPYVPGVNLRLEISCGGTLFENGTTQLNFSSSQMDQNGQYNYYIVRGPNEQICHYATLAP